MIINTKERKSYFFIHIPRTSGTQLEIKFLTEYFKADCKIPYNKNYNSLFALGQYKDNNDYWHSATHFTHNEIITLENELSLNIDQIFTIVRNPIDRAASLYRHWNFKSITNFLDYLSSINVKNKNYIGIKCNNFEPYKNIEQRVHLFLSQYSYIYPLDNIEIFKITEINKIKKIFDIPMMYWHWRQNKNRLENLELFNKDTVDKIYQIYEEDFDAFKYTKEYTETSAF